MTLVSPVVVGYAGSAAAVAFEGRRAAAIVEFLFRDAAAAGMDTAGLPPAVQFKLYPDPEKAGLILRRGDSVLAEGAPDGALAEKLLGDVCRELAAESRGGLLFHAAALSFGGGGFLVPGGIGAGKTTLALHLALMGFGYSTDEMVFVQNGAGTMRPFLRPLNLKENSRPVFEDRLDFKEDAHRMLRTHQGWLLSPALFHDTPPSPEIPVRLIVFPRFLVGEKFDFKPLTKAQATAALMECLVNSRNRPDYGLTEAARLAKTTPAFRLRYSQFGQLTEWIDSLPKNLG